MVEEIVTSPERRFRVTAPLLWGSAVALVLGCLFAAHTWERNPESAWIVKQVNRLQVNHDQGTTPAASGPNEGLFHFKDGAWLYAVTTSDPHICSRSHVTVAMDNRGNFYLTYRDMSQELDGKAGAPRDKLDNFLAWEPTSATTVPLDGEWLQLFVHNGDVTTDTLPREQPMELPTDLDFLEHSGQVTATARKPGK